MGLPHARVDQIGLPDGGAEEIEFRSPGIVNFGVAVLYHRTEVGHANAP